MRMLTLDRSFYIPAGASCVRHKASDAIVYIYTTVRGRPGAMGFHGKAQKPDFHFTYSSEAARERAVRTYFESRAGQLAAKAARRATATQPGKLQEGHILVSSWGYEQTNIDWFQVTRVISAGMVEVRQICGAIVDEGANFTGKSVPDIDKFKGEPMRRRVTHGTSLKIDNVRYASLWDGRPMSWTAYH